MKRFAMLLSVLVVFGMVLAACAPAAPAAPPTAEPAKPAAAVGLDIKTVTGPELTDALAGKF
jgi:hypothetical protein